MNDREVFNSESLNRSTESVVADRKKRNDLFVHADKIVFAGDMGDNPRNKKILGTDGTEYIVKSHRYSDSRGSVYDLMRAWA